ncbi:hypothetical protein RP20_CCG020512 [Aedes albopictus]|nr:hypothetical protein RP20_CCG020512 [Aedes albopictus]
MACKNMSSLLVKAISISLGLAIDTNHLFNSTRIPTLSNGILGFTVFSDSVYLTGVYNGRGAQSHRARIPNYANIQLEACSYPETNPPHCSYQLDIKFGSFQTVYDDPDGQLRLVHSVYPHREFGQVIVNKFRIERLNGQGTLYAKILQVPVPLSADISFQPPENEETPRSIYTRQCGTTNEVEDLELQAEKTEVCIYYKEIPTTLVLAENSTAEEFSFYTVFARSREDAEIDIRGILISIRRNDSIDEFQERRMKEVWDRYGITVDGNDELDRAIKASAFQLFSNLPRVLFTPNEKQKFGVSPSGIGRNDFQGHVMWDFDMWMMPIVVLVDPLVAQDMLIYRIEHVRKAVESNAAKNGNKGWQYPGASAFTGSDVSSDPETAELEHHVTAGVAFAVRHFFYATQNEYFMKSQGGCDLAYNTARFWKSRAIYNPTTDKYDIRAVTGPDTMNSNVTNNVFTNVVAANNLFFGEYAACICNGSLNVGKAYSEEMIRIARSLNLLYNSTGDFNPQFEGYVVGQKISQADAVLLGYPIDLPMKTSTKRRNLEIYSSVTKTSPMAAATQAIAWLELNELSLAEKILLLSYQPYMRPPFNVWNQGPIESPGASNYVSGAATFLHTMINGYAGLRLRDGEMVLDRPRLPPGTTRLYIPEINFHLYSFSLEIHQNGTFTITQKPMNILPYIGMVTIVDGVRYPYCSVYTGCTYQGSRKAILQLDRQFSECNLKPTKMNMRLAEQNGTLGTMSHIAAWFKSTWKKFF